MNRTLLTFGMFVALIVIGFVAGLAQSACYNELIKDSMLKDAEASKMSLWPFALSSSVALVVTVMLMKVFERMEVM